MLADASKRREKKIETEANRESLTQGNLVSKNSLKVYYNRFKQDFQAVIQHYELEESSQVNEDKATELCRDMGFVNDTTQAKNLMKEIWKHVGGG